MKSPSVTSVIGSVRKIRMGRTTALMMPRTSAASSVWPRPPRAMPGMSEAATQRAAALINTRSRKPMGRLLSGEREPERAVDRQHAGAADQDRQRHGDQHEVELVAGPLAGHAEVEEEPVLAVHLRDGHEHDHDDAHGGRAREQSGEHGAAAEELDERREHRRRRRQAHALEHFDGAGETVTAEPAEHLL